jgi:hypothetical protein
MSTKGRGVSGWELHPLPDPLRPADLAGAVSWLLGRATEVLRLDLAVDGPYPLAWAAAQALRNRVRFRFHHYDALGKTYTPWFEG